MKIFHCDHCQQLVFFENIQCVHCGHLLAYLPDVAQVASLDPLDGGLWRSPRADTDGHTYRQCVNYSAHQICNWAIEDTDPHVLCASCRLTTVWFPLTYVLNNLNRGLGLPDAYPFVLSAPMIDKLRFIHETITVYRDSSSSEPTTVGQQA